MNVALLEVHVMPLRAVAGSPSALAEVTKTTAGNDDKRKRGSGG